MKKIISFILVLSMLCSGITVFAANDQLKWEPYIDSMAIRFRPNDNYYSEQNSPSFQWPYVEGATYELVLANNAELTDIAYSKKDIKFNCFTFSHTLEAGKVYYWSVRYILNKKTSEWIKPRRLFIDDEACEYTVPEIEDIASVLRHNPVIFQGEVLDIYKTIDMTSDEFNKFKNTVDATIGKEIVTIPAKIPSSYRKPAQHAYDAASLYVLTGDKKYVDFFIKSIEAFKDIDPTAVFEWNSSNDIEESSFAYYFALAYDAFYNELTDEQRKLSLKIIEAHIKRPFEQVGPSTENSLYKDPFNSHGWRMREVFIASLIIYHDSNLAREIVEWFLPLFASYRDAYTYEDGSSVQGQTYGFPQSIVKYFGDAEKIGLMKFTNSATRRNTILFGIYLWPPGWTATIGDNSPKVMDMENITPDKIESAKDVAQYCSSEFYNDEFNGIGKWYLSRINSGSTQYFGNELSYLANKNVEIEAPVKLPTAKLFKDSEYVAMHSDLQDEERIGMIFHSTWYGSSNHAHPDQNSFVIQAFGEEILADSSYYNLYGDYFDKGYNKQTFAHNAITYDGKGQPWNNIDANGHITDFINQRDFRATSGDATNSYVGGLDRAKRTMIYINPSTFIVIDDLKAKEGKSSTFEYWLNTRGEIGFHEDSKGATFTGKKAKVEARVQHPEKVESTYLDYFAGPSLDEVERFEQIMDKTDKRLFFRTESLPETKIVTTLDVYKSEDENLKEIRSEKFDDYLKLSFVDGSVVFINLTDAESITTAEGIEFSGVALVYNSQSIMLVNGTSVKIDGKEFITSESPASVAFGKNEICISSIDTDSNVKIYTDELPEKIIKHMDLRLHDIPKNDSAHGVLWNTGDGCIEISTYPGTYTLYTEKKDLPGSKGTGVIKATINGKLKEIPFEGTYDSRGVLTADYNFKDLEGKYIINSTSDNVTVSGVQIGAIADMKGSISSYIVGPEAEMNLTKLDIPLYNVNVTLDPKQIEPQVDAKVRATEFKHGGEGTSAIWWDRITNYTLQYFDTMGNTIGWDIEVPADGKYDIIMSVSTVSGVTSNKFFKINGKMGEFNIPATSVYSDLDSVRVKCGVELKAGMNTLEFINVDNERTIFDWIGLIKSSK